MSGNAVALFRSQVARYAARVALRELTAGGGRADVSLTWREWGDASQAFAAALVAAGHQPGEVVGVLAGNRLCWPIADLGILSAGLVSVGVYPTSAPAQVRQVLADSGATVLVVDSAEQLAKVLDVRDDLPRLRRIICQGADADRAERWRDWIGRGRTALADPAVVSELEQRGGALAEDAVAILIYTSGSTGEPKGACITHRCLLASAASIQQTLGLTDSDTTLSFLPYCHAGERIFGLYTRIFCGMETALVEDHTRVWDAAQAFGPTVFGGLPRFFEKIFEALQVERERASGNERERWERVLELGRLRSILRRTAAEVPSGTEAEWRSLGEPLFERVQAYFGGRLRLASSGGAMLPMEVAEFLDALGVTVLGAYGMTEHLCVAFNRPHSYMFDGVGPPMPGSEVRIAEDGEILVRRSALTFSGYLNLPVETEEAFTPDGEWLLTGDFGTLDARGFLHVTGRKKELIALSTGKKIAPLPIEARLLEDPWIAQAMLYGEGQKFVSALLALRRPLIEAWARENAPGLDFSALLHHPEVLARVQETVNRVNCDLSRTEQIRRQILLDRELSLDEDELTPTLKIRRPVVAERFRDRFEALYR